MTKKLNKALFTIMLASTAVWAQAPNVTGTWQIEYHDKNGIEVDTPTVTFKQSGDHLEGVFGNQNWKIEGTIVGNAVTFAFHPPQRTGITVKYEGTLETPTRIRGTMASEVQSGTFTAVRK